MPGREPRGTLGRTIEKGAAADPSKEPRCLLPAGLAAAWTKPTCMGGETRFEYRLNRWVARATSPRGAAVVIASATTTITVGAGAMMTVIDHDGFPSLGSGLWWAVQTVTTVGYGDHVPATGAGRILATLVMLLGIGFITVITASITGALVARSNRPRTGADADARLAEQLRRIDERLERLERRLDDRAQRPDSGAGGTD